MKTVTRREMIGAAAGALTAVSLPSRASDPPKRTGKPRLKLSLAAYSFRDFLSGPNPSMDLFDFVNLAADLGLDAVEPTSYYFPENVSPDYLHHLKQHIDDPRCSVALVNYQAPHTPGRRLLERGPTVRFHGRASNKCVRSVVAGSLKGNGMRRFVMQ